MGRHNTKPKNQAMARFFAELGKKVKTTREKQGFSQAKVAEKADVDLRHYQDFEAGKVVSLRLLWAVANALNVSVSKLTKGIGPGKE
jgi:transcriptional regulator with XRE-family HTH domain